MSNNTHHHELDESEMQQQQHHQLLLQETRRKISNEAAGALSSLSSTTALAAPSTHSLTSQLMPYNIIIPSISPHLFASPPIIPLNFTLSPSSSSHLGGVSGRSCHQCKTSKSEQLVWCTTPPNGKKKRCRKKVTSERIPLHHLPPYLLHHHEFTHHSLHLTSSHLVLRLMLETKLSY